MATAAFAPGRLAEDRRFFLIMAIAMAVTIVAGFSLQLTMGRSTFASPLPVHIHAFVFFGWTILYVLQNALVARGSIALHRRLGWFGAGWAIAIVVVGLFTTVRLIRLGHVPFFFEPGYFLFMDSLSLLCFGGLVATAIRLRRRVDWHRRLMLCAMAELTGPAVGRLLPLPLMIPWGVWAVFVGVMIFPLVGMVRDARLNGRVHRAYHWGAGALAVTQIATGLVAASPLGLTIYHAATAGSPGADVAPLVYPPFPGS